ncbi:hypothetical protein D3C72_2515250 [compost metagenome]
MAVLTYCVHLKLSHNGGKQRKTKGVFPNMILGDISRFADSSKIELQPEEIENDSTKKS